MDPRLMSGVVYLLRSPYIFRTTFLAGDLSIVKCCGVSIIAACVRAFSML